MSSTQHFSGGFFYNPQTQSVLLHLRDGNTTVNPNKWGFFGGLSEGEETPAGTFIREIKEELGVDLAPAQVKELRSYLNVERNIIRHAFVVVSDLPKSAMTLTEGSDFDWVPLDDVFSYDLTDKTRDDLSYFLTRTDQCYNSAEL